MIAAQGTIEKKNKRNMKHNLFKSILAAAAFLMLGACVTDEQLVENCPGCRPITDSGECLYDIYMTVPKDCDLENVCVLKGGKFAVYHFRGPVRWIYNAYQSVFNVWLPKSGHMVDGRYGFDIYREVDCDSMNMVIDICIPIK